MSATPPQNESGPQGYAKQYEAKARFAGHLDISFRSIKPSDAHFLKEFFFSHSEQTVVHRYFAPLRELSPDQVKRFVELDFDKDMAIVGLAPFQDRQRILCIGRYFRGPAASSAEIAITVHDDYQGRGMGTFLLHALIRVARAHGIETLTADVLADNHAMMRLLHKCSSKLKINLEAGVYHVVLPVEEAASNNAKSLPKFGKKTATPSR